MAVEPLQTELLLKELKTVQKTIQDQEFLMPMQEVTVICNAIQNIRLQLPRVVITEILNLQVEEVTGPVIQVEAIQGALARRLRALDLAGLQVLPLQADLLLHPDHLKEVPPLHQGHQEQDNLKNTRYVPKDTFCHIIPMQFCDNCPIIKLC